MNPEAQNKAIAESIGWREAFPKSGAPHRETKRGGILLPYNWVNERTHERETNLPDYLNDLNAMHEAEKSLGHDQQDDFTYELGEIAAPITGEEWLKVHATAAQRAEAYLKCLGLWKD